jgi:CheY-like chemotaxis protein
MSTPRILLAEDDRFLRKAAETMLKRGGFTVTTAGDGEEALRLARESAPDLMLLDLVMPKMHGFDVLAALKAAPETAAIPVIAQQPGPGQRRPAGARARLHDYITSRTSRSRRSSSGCAFSRTARRGRGAERRGRRARGGIRHNGGVDPPRTGSWPGVVRRSPTTTREGSPSCATAPGVADWPTMSGHMPAIASGSDQAGGVGCGPDRMHRAAGAHRAPTSAEGLESHSPPDC